MDLNRTVSFRLTPRGEKVYKKHYQELAERYSLENPNMLNPYTRRVELKDADSRGWREMIFWEFIHVFGAGSIMGVCLFKGNEVFFKRPKK